MPADGVIQAVLTVAQDVARRRHHPIVRAPHVIAALLMAPGMDRRIRRRGHDADHLAATVERALDDMPAVALYRDAGPPEICSSIELALERSENHVAAYGAIEIVPALENAAELRGAFRPYVLDESLVAVLRREAPGRDIADAMTWLLANHLDLAERLVDAGLDTTDLTTRCLRDYGSVLSEAIDTGRSTGARAVDAALLTAFFTREIAYAAGYELPIIGDALDRLFHGEPVVDATFGENEPADVVFVNDPMTRAVTVQTILTSHFDMSAEEAAERVMAIDAYDSAIVARVAAGPARDLADLARRTARRDGDPLRVIVRGCA